MTTPQVLKCADPECEAPIMEVVGGRREGGRTLPYKYHSCTKCNLVQATDEDLKWNAEEMRKFYGESVRRSLTPQHKFALYKAKGWCLVVNTFYKVMFPNSRTWYLYPTVTTKIDGEVVTITASDSDGRIIRTFWK